jgi:DNA-binding MarR family transcriptional regulator
LKISTSEVVVATPQSCVALVDAFPSVLRWKRRLAPTATPATAVLVAIRTLGSPRPSELAGYLRLDVSTVSRQVAHLRDVGLVSTGPDPDDGRSQRLSLSRAGEDELSRHRDHLAHRISEQLDDWDDTDVDVLARLLTRLGSTVAAPPAPPPPAPPPSTSTPRTAAPSTPLQTPPTPARTLHGAPDPFQQEKA